MGIFPATSDRYLAEAIGVLPANLHQALQQVADEGCPHVRGDGTVVACHRPAEKTTSRTAKTIDTGYSGKTGGFGGTIHTLIRPDGLPVEDTRLGPRPDHHPPPPLGASYWAASQLELPTDADAGYHGAGVGVHPRPRLPLAAS